MCQKALGAVKRASRAISAVDRATTVQWAARDVMSHVSGTEFKVLMCIIDRTVLWGKDVERITQKHISEGIPGTCGGTGISVRAIRNGLQRLQEIGVISVTERTSGNTYSVNTSWRKVMLKVPKNKKERPTGLKVSAKGGKICPHGRQNLPIIRRELIKKRTS